MALRHLFTQVVDGGRRVLGGQIGGAQPAFEEVDLDDETLVLPLEVGQGLLGRTRLPRAHDPLAVRRPHVHGPRLVDAAPRLAAHSASL
jgi:hypothetical protein